MDGVVAERLSGRESRLLGVGVIYEWSRKSSNAQGVSVGQLLLGVLPKEIRKDKCDDEGEECYFSESIDCVREEQAFE